MNFELAVITYKYIIIKYHYTYKNINNRIVHKLLSVSYIS
jgi:hypothetical protein